MPVISIREHFNLTTGTLFSNHNSTDYIFDWESFSECLPQMAIFVHGWNSDQEMATENLTRQIVCHIQNLIL